MTEKEQAVGILDMFRVRGDVLMDGLLKVLHWAHAMKGIKLDAAQIQSSIPFSEVGHLVQDRQLPTKRGASTVTVDVSDIPDTVLAPFRAYLHVIPDFDPALPVDKQPSDEPKRHHDFVVTSLRKNLESYLV